jgi:hypothetical protein
VADRDEQKRIGEQPLPGMRDDGTLPTYEPGADLPQPKIIMPDGSVVTPAELAAIEAIEDDAELQAAYEAAAGDDLDEPDED